jgi:hypothetical protein
MTTITTSEARTWLRCREEHRWRYVERLLPVGPLATALAFGSAVHAGLEGWWRSMGLQHEQAIEDAVRVGAELGLDEYQQVMVRVMLERYHRFWRDEQWYWQVVGVEEEFIAERRGYLLAGKVDALVELNEGPRRRYVVEHKTTSEDIGPGMPYWRRLSIDMQVSNYLIATGAQGCIYDVLRKPKLTPHRATPWMNRKYRKDGALYAGQHAEDESLDAWKARLLEAYEDSSPGTWFRREIITRLDGELVRAGQDIDAIGREIAAQKADPKPQPRNTEACTRYGRPCEYQGLCYGEETPTDGRFHVLDREHQELAP